MTTATTVERGQTSCDLEMGPVADATEPARRREEETTTAAAAAAAGPGRDDDDDDDPGTRIVCCMLSLFALALVSLGVCIAVGTPAAERVCLPIFCSSLILLVCIFGCAAAHTQEADDDDEADETEGWGRGRTSSRRRVDDEQQHQQESSSSSSHAKVPVTLSFQPCMTVANL
jgi:hypothetical protein